MKKYLFIFLIIGLLFISGCKDEKSDHECIEGTWVFQEETKCLEEGLANLVCNECGETIEVAVKKKSHSITIEEKEATCSEDGYYLEKCGGCDYEYLINYEKTGEHKYFYEIYTKASDNRLGTKQKKCETCKYEGNIVKYANNGFSDHGELSVVGPDLVDEKGEKFQLIGISTHGLQWFNKYVNY